MSFNKKTRNFNAFLYWRSADNLSQPKESLISLSIISFDKKEYP